MSEESKALEETAKAGQEIAKTAGQLIGFIARITTGPLEQASGIFEDKLKYIRWERQLRLLRRAEEFLKEAGRTTPYRAIPLKFAIPLLQNGSLEDDNEIQDLWAKLIANAANTSSKIDIKRAYIDILKSIGPLEAQILKTIYALPFEQMQHQGVSTADLPTSASILPNKQSINPQSPNPEVQLALANLSRLGCLLPTKSWGGGEIFNSINPTLLGKSFIEACTLSVPAIESPSL